MMNDVFDVYVYVYVFKDKRYEPILKPKFWIFPRTI